jgi:hypothetical protein
VLPDRHHSQSASTTPLPACDGALPAAPTGPNARLWAHSTVLAAHLKATLSQFVAVLREAEGSLGRTLHFYLLQVPRAQRPSPSASAHSTAPRPALARVLTVRHRVQPSASTHSTCRALRPASAGSADVCRGRVGDGVYHTCIHI